MSNASPPPGYVEPAWPALYSALHQDPQYLYRPYAIWRFTLYWTLLMYGFVYLISGIIVVINFPRHRRQTLTFLGAWMLFATLVAFISSSLVGFTLAALYNAAFLRMSTWVPPLWGAMQAMLLIFAAAANIPFIAG